MLGISYGEFFVLLGATAALLGPKDLPLVARAAGRLAGRAIGYVQLVRGQLDNAMHKSQFSQVHKELQDTMAQLEAIRYEIRSVSIMNPGPFTRRLDGSDPPPNNDTGNAERSKGEFRPLGSIHKDFSPSISISSSLQSQATIYSKFAEAQSMNSSASKVGENVEKLNEDSGLLVVLPVSAESAGFLPKHSEEVTGSDIVLEAVLEAEVAQKSKQFFSQPENQIPKE